MNRKYKIYLSILLCICTFFISIPAGLAEDEISENTVETGEAVQLLIKYRNLEEYQFELEHIKRIRNKNYASVRTNADEQWDILQLDSQEDAEYYFNRLSEVDLCLYIDYYQGQATEWPQIPLSGDGSVNHPFQIFTEDDLRLIGIYNNADYKLMNDIELTQPWIPVETYAGTFNGNGHTISNITFQAQEGDALGFFNHLYQSAYVLNTAFVCNDITSSNESVGVIAGKNSGRIIECAAEAVIQEDAASEGLVGQPLIGSSVEECQNNTNRLEKQEAESIVEIDIDKELQEADDKMLALSSRALSGSGTEQDPYKVYDKYDLNAVRNNLGACYVQLADITFDDSDYATTGDFYNNGLLFLPIGGIRSPEYPTEAPFTGKYDGNGFKITNLKMQAYNGTEIMLNIALFGMVKKIVDNDFAVLQNIILDNANIEADLEGGGLAVEISNAVIEKCVFDGELITSYGGGICNRSYDSVIQKCVNKAAIKGWPYSMSNTATICQSANGTLIDQCVNTGELLSAFPAGLSFSSSTTIVRDSYNAANLNGVEANFLSGISSGGTVINCYMAGEVTPPGVYSEYNMVGAIRDTSLDSSQCENNYYLKFGDINGTQEGDIPGKFIPLTEEQMKQQSSFVGFDFENVWEIDPTAEYPYPTLRDVPVIHKEKEEISADMTYRLVCLFHEEPKMYINVSAMEDIQNKEFTIIYNPLELELLDACAMTGKDELLAGAIVNTKITLVSVDTRKGFVTFRYDEPLLTDGKNFSGTINVLSFLSHIEGSTVLGLTVTERRTEE